MMTSGLDSPSRSWWWTPHTVWYLDEVSLQHPTRSCSYTVQLSMKIIWNALWQSKTGWFGRSCCCNSLGYWELGLNVVPDIVCGLLVNLCGSNRCLHQTQTLSDSQWNVVCLEASLLWRHPNFLRSWHPPNLDTNWATNRLVYICNIFLMRLTTISNSIFILCIFFPNNHCIVFATLPHLTPKLRWTGLCNKGPKNLPSKTSTRLGLKGQVL